MSDEELERLAAAMKDMKPRDTARQRGMDAAMSAFESEFAVDNETVNKKAETRQGSAAELRHMGQTKGRPMMSKFKSIFNMPPRSAMLLGSCLAAMTFAIVIVPPMMSEQLDQEFHSVTTEIEPAEAPVVEKVTAGVVDAKKDRIAKAPPAASGADEDDEIVVTGSRQVREEMASNAPVAPAPQAAQGGSVSDVLQEIRSDSSQVLAENRQREMSFRAERNQRMGQLSEIVTNHDAIAEGDAQEQLNKSVSDLTAGTDKIIQEMGEQELRLFDGNRDRFEAFEPNPITAVRETPVSTFSIDVDTASYSFLRSTINQGRLPQPGSIRLEEMINYFPYDYAAPRSKSEPFKANVTVTSSPWNTDTKLMHIGIKGYVPPVSETPSSNIVFLIDTSGSMRAKKKLPLLIESFKVLLETLDEDDTVSIVTYAGSAGTVLEPTPASETGTIKRALNNLQAGGSTAGAAGLALAYEKAQESFDKDGVNRVILATDGDFNVGFSSPDEMRRFIEKKRKSGIFLSVLGFGSGNYNDALMQSLAQNGNGVAAYIDSLSEAKKVLADEAGSALIPIAKDVKIQVEFNPVTVAEYRLIGYETRALRREDFNNDKVDAGDINSGHSVTAIYELTPVGSPAVSVDDLRYAEAAPAPKPSLASASDEFAFIKIRHKLPNSDKSTLQTFPVGLTSERDLGRAADDMRFATAVAAFGQKLRGDSQLSEFTYKDIARLASDAEGDDEHGYRAEFLELVREVDRLSGE